MVGGRLENGFARRKLAKTWCIDICAQLAQFLYFSLKGPIAFIKISYVHNKWNSHTPFLIR